jgi:hypothetical protein
MGNDGIPRPLIIGHKGDNVTCEIRLAWRPAEHSNSNALGPGYLPNYCLDLLKIYAMATDLYLTIEAAEEDKTVLRIFLSPDHRSGTTGSRLKLRAAQRTVRQ